MPCPQFSAARLRRPALRPPRARTPPRWQGRAPAGIRSPLSPLGADFHGRVEAALQQANCIEREATAVGGSFGWPSRDLLLQGHLFDQNLINQALELIEKRGAQA